MVQLYLKLAAIADLAGYGNGAMVQLHDALANGKPDPESGKLSRIGRSEKRVENMREVVFANPYAPVADFYNASFIVGGDQYLRAMVGRVLAGIVEQVGEYPFK